MRVPWVLLAATICGASNSICPSWERDPSSCLEKYNVVWNDLLPESQDTFINTMPLGNGRVAANVYSNGKDSVSLLFSASDAWNEGSELIKIGTVTVTVDPQPPTGHFKQYLDIATATIFIELGDLQISTYIDANSNTTVIDLNNTKYTVKATSSLARPKPQSVQGQFECQKYDISADQYAENGAAFYHRNQGFPEQDYFKNMVEGENLGPKAYSSMPNLLLNRTSGGYISSSGQRTTVSILTKQTSTVDEWVSAVKSATAVPNYSAHVSWWKSFWERSYVEISDYNVTSKYILQRYLQGCQARSPFPMKFNGMLYTATKDLDVRGWGGRNWWQNLRLPYYNMLAAGDSDMLLTLLTGFHKTLPLAKARTEHYFNISGAYWPEYTDALFGTTHHNSYGCNRAGKTDPPYWYNEDRWNHYNFQGSLDLSLFAIDYYTHTGKSGEYMEIVENVLEFYAGLRPARDAQGKMILYPTQSAETWQCPGYPPDPKNCPTNDMPTVAGLQSVLSNLLLTDYGSDKQRTAWKDLLAIIPPLPVNSTNLLPCEKCPPRTSNVENTELYAVHPYRLYTAGRMNASELTLANNAMADRRFRSDVGWNQCAMDAALLGHAADAQSMVVARAHYGPAPGYRFPGFMQKFQDYAPSLDHLSVHNNAVVYMLMQQDDSATHNITLLPAWPCDWDVTFKLHGPLQTVITGSVTNGVISYEVSPIARRPFVHAAACQQK
eukprot:TRINITY_DN2336_c0_g1_i3.p1 TRINITY_DN2336_c0_g1~~TRINITY_DN2336_c0_g1_i3.p1  ORF type:complete len:722 (+),score=143.17 TRINITY_DN2336_c0_g1_i3:122-2287(+)